MSHLKRVESWRDDVKAKIARVGPETEYGRELQKNLAMYEQLLAELREINQPKQRTLLREMGDEPE
jgi:hypothetical protein